MSGWYYNAIVLTDYGSKITYHDIVDIPGFMSFVLKERSAVKIFFYKKRLRKERGVYCGYWNDKKGLQIN